MRHSYASAVVVVVVCARSLRLSSFQHVYMCGVGSEWSLPAEITYDLRMRARVCVCVCVVRPGSNYFNACTCVCVCVCVYVLCSGDPVRCAHSFRMRRGQIACRTAPREYITFAYKRATMNPRVRYRIPVALLWVGETEWICMLCVWVCVCVWRSV